MWTRLQVPGRRFLTAVAGRVPAGDLASVRRSLDQGVRVDRRGCSSGSSFHSKFWSSVGPDDTPAQTRGFGEPVCTQNVRDTHDIAAGMDVSRGLFIFCYIIGTTRRRGNFTLGAPCGTPETFAGRRLWGPGLVVWLEGSALGSAKEPGGTSTGVPTAAGSVLHRAALAAHRAYTVYLEQTDGPRASSGIRETGQDLEP